MTPDPNGKDRDDLIAEINAAVCLPDLTQADHVHIVVFSDNGDVTCLTCSPDEVFSALVRDPFAEEVTVDGIGWSLFEFTNDVPSWATCHECGGIDE